MSAIVPPARLKTKDLVATAVPEGFHTAWGIVNDIGIGFRYRGLIVGDVQRDLIRFASLHHQPLWFALRGQLAPCPIFTSDLVERWLDEGGRSWIIAELEARSGRRVVPFPRKAGDDV